MTELNRGQCAVRAEEVCDAAILRNVAIAVDAGAVIGFARALLNGCLLAEDDAGTTQRKFAEVHEMPIGRTAVFRAVLTHR